MEVLFKIYSDRQVQGNEEQQLFFNFYSDSDNRAVVETCLHQIMEKEQVKNEVKANKLRCTGNVLYKKKNYVKSLYMYSRALCSSPLESETYGIIISNRSAVLFMMKHYLECLIDINNCLHANLPDKIKIKLYIRKIKCCYYAKGDEYNNLVLEALNFLYNSTSIEDKSFLEKEIMSFQNKEPLEHRIDQKVNDDLPEIKQGFNDSFLYASSSISLRYDEKRGRHVTATTLLNQGDVIFIEKPFIFAPVFTSSTKELPLNKCYNCLNTVYTSIPCKYCTKCIFCNETCRSSSWNEFHKWECRGMRSDLWYHIGIAFPAFRAVVRGIPVALAKLINDYEADTIKFGDQFNNYLYFNKLLAHIDKMCDVQPLILCAATVVTYLIKHTNFFTWLLKQKSCPKQNFDDLYMYIGGLLVRHIGQLQCNSSVIQHDDSCSTDDPSIACAIYPSISMMNHSCKPNITILYVRDLVVVRAAETINPGEEVFNCYGIDYRFLNTTERQKQCLNLYHFKCECRACVY